MPPSDLRFYSSERGRNLPLKSTRHVPPPHPASSARPQHDDRSGRVLQVPASLPEPLDHEAPRWPRSLVTVWPSSLSCIDASAAALSEPPCPMRLASWGTPDGRRFFWPKGGVWPDGRTSTHACMESGSRRPIAVSCNAWYGTRSGRRVRCSGC
jgi:hypothetical protein